MHGNVLIQDGQTHNSDIPETPLEKSSKTASLTAGETSLREHVDSLQMCKNLELLRRAGTHAMILENVGPHYSVLSATVVASGDLKNGKQGRLQKSERFSDNFGVIAAR